MSNIIAIRGTNGSGKSSVVRALLAYLGKPIPFLFDGQEAGYRCNDGKQTIFVLGKYRTACGGLDASFSYKSAADDVLLCLGLLAEKGHVVCEGVIAMSSYGFGRLARFANDQRAKGNNVIFASLDTPLELCLKRVRARRKEARNSRLFDPERLAEKYASVLRSREELREAGYDARVLPHEDPLQTLLRWLAEQNPAKLVEGELSRFQTSDIKSESSPQPSLNVEVAGVAPPPRTSVCELQCGMDFRKPEYRHEVFLRFYEFHLKYGTHPGCVYFVLPFLFKKYSWDLEQRLWFAFINGNTQNPITSKIIFDEFPDFAALNLTRLNSWFNAKWPVLAFDNDRRHHKKEFIKAVTTYKKLCPSLQAEYFDTFMGGDDPYENFRSAWKEVREKFHSFGRLSGFSYLEYIRIMRVGKIDCDQLFLEDMQGSKSHRNGLAIVLGRDDLYWHDSNPGFNGEYTPETLAWLKEEGARLLAEAKQRAEAKPYFYDVSYFTLESALCTYKSWHRPNRRYPNAYADMFHDRIKKAEQHWPGRDFSEFWSARREYLPEHLRLEDNPADVGLKPLKQNHYRLTGQVIMMDEEWTCFKNDYNDKVNAARRGTTATQIDSPRARDDRGVLLHQEGPQPEAKSCGTWQDGLYDLTPVENIGGVWFKREDKFSPDGMHNGSKFRQLIWLFSRKQYPGVTSGAVTGSPQLPMVAACAKHYGMKCVQFTGARKNMALAGERLGAKSFLVNPGYGPLLNKRAQDYAKGHGWLHIQTNITCDDVEEFHRVGSEQVKNFPEHIETLIVPAGSRNSATSIFYGLHRYPPQSLKRIILLNIAPNLEKKEEWMWERLKACGVSTLPYEIQTHDVFADGYTDYNKLMPFSHNGLTLHPRYEGKCWNYIKDNVGVFRPYLNEKTLFWIVGSEPKSCAAWEARGRFTSRFAKPTGRRRAVSELAARVHSRRKGSVDSRGTSMIFRLCNGKQIRIPDSLLRFGEQFKQWGNTTSWLAEFLQKNSANNFSFLLGAMSMRKLCTYRLREKIKAEYTSYLEPLGGAGIDAKLFENDPAQTYVNDIDPGCLEILRENFQRQCINSLNFFDKTQRAELLKTPVDLIFVDYNNYTLVKLEEGTYKKETRDVLRAAKKFVILNDCSTFYMQYGKKSYARYSELLGTKISNLDEYFAALAAAPLYSELGWYLTDVTHFYWASAKGNDVSSYQLFRRTPKPLEIEFVPREALKQHPMLVVE